MIDLARFGSTVDYAELATRYVRSMRAYLEQGVLPDGELRLVLEGNLAAALGRDELSAFAVSRLQRWIEAHLPRSAYGNRDQVQLWIVYVRRARGRALLAAMEGCAPNANAPPEARP